jgi:hypothetical protein
MLILLSRGIFKEGVSQLPEINDLTEYQAKAALNEIVNKLDLLDCEDFFGTEGWRKFLNIKTIIPPKI